MKPEVKAKWIKALTGGHYRKTTGQLRRPGGNYCCLGVLCDLYAKEKGLKWEGNSILDEACALPSDVMVWAGLNARDAKIKVGLRSKRRGDDGRYNSLIDLNDDADYKFKDIAAVIRKYL